MAGELAAGEGRRFLLYGLGNGRGHATRMGALSATLRSLGAETLLLVNEEALCVAEAMGVAREHLVGVTNQTSAQCWGAAFQGFVPTDCVIDTFPEGLHQELAPELRADPQAGPRWVALLRCRRDAHSERFVNALAGYPTALDLEPDLDWVPQAPLPVRVVPFGTVIRELPRGSVAPNSLQKILLIATETKHRSFLERLDHRLRALGLSVERYPAGGTSRYFAPLLDRQWGEFKVVVGPAGYNLTYELAALGIWHLALPGAREFDHQELRAQRISLVTRSPDALERRLLTCLQHAGPRPIRPSRSMRELAHALLVRQVQG